MEDYDWFERLNMANSERSKLWGGGDQVDLSFLGMEIGEEAGEVLGALKKLIRHDRGIQGNKEGSRSILETNLQSEVGDLLINISRLCVALDLDAYTCASAAFNNKSKSLNIGVFI